MSKSILNILLLVSLFSSNYFAQEIESFMKMGNDLYQNKKYEEAINSYEAILKQGFLSSDLYYNLGNAYFKKGDIGRAILNYERSIKIDPTNEDAIYNLKIAKARTVDKIQELPKLFIVKWWEIVLSKFTSTGWQTIIFIFYIILLICIAMYFLVRNVQIRKLSFLIGSVDIFILMLVSFLFFASLQRETSNDYGVLLQSVATVKVSPDSQSDDAFVIHEGIKFKIEDEVDNWAKIKLSDGKVGWLPTNIFDVI